MVREESLRQLFVAFCALLCLYLHVAWSLGTLVAFPLRILASPHFFRIEEFVVGICLVTLGAWLGQAVVLHALQTFAPFVSDPTSVLPLVYTELPLHFRQAAATTAFAMFLAIFAP